MNNLYKQEINENNGINAQINENNGVQIANLTLVCNSFSESINLIKKELANLNSSSIKHRIKTDQKTLNNIYVNKIRIKQELFHYRNINFNFHHSHQKVIDFYINNLKLFFLILDSKEIPSELKGHYLQSDKNIIEPLFKSISSYVMAIQNSNITFNDFLSLSNKIKIDAINTLLDDLNVTAEKLMTTVRELGRTTTG
jgi:hypothetical protein